MKKFDLQERLIDYSVVIIKFRNDIARSHFAGQLVRTGTFPALN